MAAMDALGNERRPGLGFRLLSMPAAWVAITTAVLVAGYLAAPGPGLGAWLGDTDDAVRLLTVRELLAGASWFDTTLPRLGAPDALLSHWSRLLDAPLAGLVGLLTPLLGREAAEIATRAAWPVLVFAGLAAIVARSARAQAGTWGMAFAMLEATTILATLVRDARLEWDGRHLPAPVSRVTLQPAGGMPLIVTPLAA
mgnify:CR=1 FL=1